MDLVTKAMHCKGEHAINLKPGQTILDKGLIPLLRNRTFPLEYLTYTVINRMEFCECTFSAGPF